jgi:serine/threonine-protein kinase
MASSRLALLAEQRVGTQLRRGKYTLGALLGVGSMAAVYRATHRNGSEVAIKVMHTSLVGDDGLHARFLREALIVNKVNHPGLVKIIDDDVDDNGATFLVMELLSGKTLADERDALGGTIPPIQLLHVVREVLGTLIAVHAAGIVHRDVKPENIFLLDSGGVKLLDLGVARLGASKQTAPGETLGSPAYMPPEQAMGKQDEIDARSDIFAVGAILFTLLTGQYVHEGASPQVRLVAAATKPARPFFDVWPDAKGALANLIDVALRFDRQQRWSSAEEMRRALDDVLTLMIPADLRPPPPTQPTGAVPMASPSETVLGWPSPWSGDKPK